MCLSDAPPVSQPGGVLITRPQPAADATAQLLAARGYVCHLAPMLIIRPEPTLKVADVQAIVITSANALPALSGFNRTLRILAVGDATAAQAMQAGFTHVRSAGRDATALADLVAAECEPTGGALLLASGGGQGLDLAADLRGRGFRVHRRVAYRRMAAEAIPDAALAALAAGRIGHAIFFSADTARAFVRCIEHHKAALAGVVALAISPHTATALRSVAWRAIHVATHPNQDELVALLP